MLEHHIQKQIVYRLAFSEGLRFSELKPDNIENKLFDYHLKKVLAADLVTKGDDGLYRLTADGRRAGISIYNKQLTKLEKARSVLILVVRSSATNDWLLYKRKTHPQIDKIGFMHSSPRHDQSILKTATEDLKAKTGLTATFEHTGDGYITVYEGSNLESFTHFTMLSANDAEGELKQNDDRADYFWEAEPDFSSNEMLPNMELLSERYQDGKTFFIEQSFHLD